MKGLDRLLRPKSVAIIGGGDWGRYIIQSCQKIGYSGDIWLVHPKRDQLEGLPVYRSLADLPGVPDAAYIVVNRFATIEVVKELSRMGCGGAICFASGFSESVAEDAGGAQLQAQLVSAAGEMTIVGPNCYGFVNYLDGAALWPDQEGGTKVDRGVGIISQSSNMAINMTMQKRGLPLAYMTTVGNQAQTGLSQMGIEILRDPRVTALGLHIEGIDSISGFEALAAEAKSLGKPIVALKVGKSEQAQAATVSHTASLAGSDAGANALLSRLGIARLDSLPAFLETLKLLHVVGPLTSNRIASMSCSGGEASLMADSALDRDLVYPPLSADQKDGLRDALGPMVALANPLDYHTYIWRDRKKIGQTFAAMMRGDLGLGMVVLDYPRQDRCEVSDWYDVPAGMENAIAESGKPMALVATLPECLPESEALKVVDQGIAPLMGMAEALAAVEAAAWLGTHQKVSDPVLAPGKERVYGLITEAEAKKELESFGLHVPLSVIADSAAATAKAASAIGFPVVLKGAGLAHKTEAGAVKVGLSEAGQVVSAAKAMAAESFLVEEMITGGILELLIGVVRDPAHGFVLTVGAGGQLTEILADTSSLILPVTRDDVEGALDRLRCAPLIAGYRGQIGADKSAIIDAVLAVQEYVVANSERLSEVEINPLIATPDRAVAVDALIRIGKDD